MSQLSRRQLLRGSLGWGAVLGLAGLDLGDLYAAQGAKDPFRGGVKLGDLAFHAEPRDPLGTRIASGLDARLYTDLARVDTDRRITPVEEFFIRTEVPDRLDPSRPWRIALGGDVERPATWTPADLEKHTEPQGIHMIECAGNSRATRFGLMSTADWAGVPLARVFSEIGPRAGAKAVKVAGFDDHSRGSTNSTAGCSWIFNRDPLEATGAFLATHMNGRPLTPEHGFPVRLVVPGWYGCCCIKWVTHIDLVDDQQPATSQMREFAARTHQDGVPDRAADYAPAVVDRAALPVRVEKWRVEGKIVYRVVGIDWGGDRSGARLQIRFGPAEPFVPVGFSSNDEDGGWAVWVHPWTPPAPGPALIQLKIDDPSVSSRRLSSGFYIRGVVADEV